MHNDFLSLLDKVLLIDKDISAFQNVAFPMFPYFAPCSPVSILNVIYILKVHMLIQLNFT